MMFVVNLLLVGKINNDAVKEAPEGKYPYQAVIYYNNGHSRQWPMCSGSIIDERYILTTAECLK